MTAIPSHSLPHLLSSKTDRRSGKQDLRGFIEESSKHPIMPSRKKAKGKARKAAKEAAKESQAAVSADQRQKQQESLELEAQMQILQISRGLSTKCRHGFDDASTICEEFIATFITAFLSNPEDDMDMADAFKTAHAATAGEKFADVYSFKLETVVSNFSAFGADSFLGGNIDSAQFYAALAFYFEELIAVDVEKTKVFVNWTKVVELTDYADDHTLAKFFRKRIPCHCLDEKYKEVKSVKKMGMCCNPNCSVRNVERSKMLCCTGCGICNYCSIECQKNDWKKHKKFCANIAEEKAAFKKQS